MKKQCRGIRTIVGLVVVLLLQVACATLAPAGSSPPPQQFPTDAATHTAVPPAPSHETATAQIAFWGSLWLTYDPELWEARPVLDSNQAPHLNQSGEPVVTLTHRQYGCELRDNLGHGMGEQFQLLVEERSIGGSTFQVEQWTDTSINEITLVVYQYPAGTMNNDAKRIELGIDGNSAECISAAQEVLAQSAANIVG